MTSDCPFPEWLAAVTHLQGWVADLLLCDIASPAPVLPTEDKNHHSGSSLTGMELVFFSARVKGRKLEPTSTSQWKEEKALPEIHT